MKDLIFNAERHEYKLVDDTGRETILPFVTQIASAVTGKDLSKVPAKVLAAAGERGTAIHRDVEAGTMATKEGAWIEQQIDRQRCIFERMDFTDIDGLTYAGTSDIATEDEIDDIKSQAEQDILYWTIQLNLYRQFYDGVKRLRVFWVPKSGTYKPIDIQVLSDEQMKEIVSAYREGRVLPSGWLDADRPEAPTLDLIVYNQTPGQLATNARAILETVKKQLESYKAENYSEANIADAKKDKAELNAASKKLNDRRIELEREYMKPFEEFKGLIAETCAEIKTASGQIDAIVKEVEQREKDEKRAAIETFWKAQACDLFKLSQVFKDSWLNKGTKLKDVESEITERIAKVKSDLVILDRINEPDAKAYYLDTLDLDRALGEADRIKANRARIAKMAETVPVPVETFEDPAPVEEPVVVSFEANRPKEQPELLERTFRVRCTMEALVALSQYLNSNGIQFEKL